MLFKHVLNKFKVIINRKLGINYHILQYTFTSKSEVIDITDSTILKNIKARLQSGDRQVILKFTNKKDKSREGSRTDRENNNNKKDNSKKSSKIDRENDGKNKNNTVLLLQQN